MRFGQQGVATSKFGEKYSWTYRIVNGVFFIINDYPSYTIVKKLKTNGKDSCSEEIEFKKRPGHEYFEVNSKNFSEVRAANVVCTISSGS